MNTLVPVLCIFAAVSFAIATKSDVCLLEAFKGGDHDVNCLMYETLWTFDYYINQCVEFVYGGCGGNDNRFYSREECEDACKETDPCAMKPYTGSAYDDIKCIMGTESWLYNYDLNKCVSYGGCGGNGNNFKSQEECETTCQKDVCQEEPFSGSEYYGLYCYLDIPTWTYVAGMCVEYSYGGCGGNRNQFTSLAQCEKTCMK